MLNWRGSLAATAVVAASVFSGGAGASASTYDVAVRVAADGTAPFDALDADAANGTVRTADTVTWRVDWSVNDADSTQTRLRLRSGPNHHIVGLPAGCRAGSTVTSSEVLCELGARRQGESGTITVDTLAGQVRNGSLVSIEAAVEGDGPTVATASPTVATIAQPGINLRSDFDAAQTVAAEAASGAEGRIWTVPFTLESPTSSGGRGVEPLAPGQTVTVRFDLGGLPAGVEWANPDLYAAPPTYRRSACGPVDGTHFGVPFGDPSFAPTPGTAAAAPTGWGCVWDAASRFLDVSFTMPDELVTPSLDAGQFPLGGRTVQVAGQVNLWAPGAMLAPISGVPGAAQIEPVATSFVTPPVGVSGAAVTDEPSDNQSTLGWRYTLPGSYDAHYSGPASLVHADQGYGDIGVPSPLFTFAGVPEYTPFVPTQTPVYAFGDGVVSPGQQFGIRVQLGADIDGPDGVSKSMCIALGPNQEIIPVGSYLDIDYRPVDNMTGLFAGRSPVVNRVPSDGIVQTTSNVMHAQNSWFAWWGPNDTQTYSVEYSTTMPDGSGQCGDSAGPWTTNPADPTAVRQVRVVANHMAPGAIVWAVLSMRALEAPVGSHLWFTTSGITTVGAPTDLNSTWDTDAVPFTETDRCGPSLPRNPFNDCLTVGGAKLSISTAVASARSADLADGDMATIETRLCAVGSTGTGTVPNSKIFVQLPPHTRWTGVASPAATAELYWELGDLGYGECRTVTYEVEVVAGYEPRQVLPFVASGSGDSMADVSASTQITTSGVFGQADVVKAVTAELIDPDSVAEFTLTASNTGVTTLDGFTLVDVLPRNGDAYGTLYTGTTELGSVTAPDGATVYYTSADPATVSLDPDIGSTHWCSASELGASGCPLNVGGATAVKVDVPGPNTPGSTFDVKIRVATNGNDAGDVYANRFGARVGGLELPVRSNVVSTTVAGSKLALSKTCPKTATVGDTIECVLTASNTGPSVARGVTIVDTGAPGMTVLDDPWVGDIDPGAVVSTTVKVRVDESGDITNTASIVGTGITATAVVSVSPAVTTTTTTSTTTSSTVPETATSTTTVAAAPASTTTTVAVGSTPEGAPSGLAWTGLNTGLLAAVAAVFIAAGFAAVIRTRRR